MTGGTAASRGYLNHRFSDDLDLFVNDDASFTDATQGILAAPVNALVTDPQVPTTLYSGGTGVFRSADAGATWEKIFDDRFCRILDEGRFCGRCRLGLTIRGQRSELDAEFPGGRCAQGHLQGRHCLRPVELEPRDGPRPVRDRH